MPPSETCNSGLIPSGCLQGWQHGHLVALFAPALPLFLIDRIGRSLDSPVVIGSLWVSRVLKAIFAFYSRLHIDRAESPELPSLLHIPARRCASSPQPLPLCGPEIGTVIIDFDASGNRGRSPRETRSEAASGRPSEPTPLGPARQSSRRGDSQPREPFRLPAAARALVLVLATAGGAGLAPVAPGTAGALVGVFLFLPFSHLGLPLYGLTLVAFTCLGIWVSDVAERIFERSDDGRIVIDEVVGQLLTLLPLLVLEGWPRLAGVSLEIREGSWWALVLTAFVLFRVLDIWKPGPVRWAERRFAGGAGVMADDIVAGGLGALVLAVAVSLVVGWSAT